MSKPHPLWLRLYSQECLFELARLIGYQGLPLPEAQARLQPLNEKFGTEKMAAAAEELVHLDESTNPPTARLKPAVRKLCWQLLGPPPEEAEAFHRGGKAPPPLGAAQPPSPVVPAEPEKSPARKPRKTRTKPVTPPPPSDERKADP